MPNPLAIGVTLGGLFLDVIAPRPKPRVGLMRESLSSRAPGRPEDTMVGEPVGGLHGSAVASGS